MAVAGDGMCEEMAVAGDGRCEEMAVAGDGRRREYGVAEDERRLGEGDMEDRVFSISESLCSRAPTPMAPSGAIRAVKEPDPLFGNRRQQPAFLFPSANGEREVQQAKKKVQHMNLNQHTTQLMEDVTVEELN
ncbi:hypothetical protein LINGRAHAP2_LOCUS31946 [Linum grandiflorum]